MHTVALLQAQLGDRQSSIGAGVTLSAHPVRGGFGHESVAPAPDSTELPRPDSLTGNSITPGPLAGWPLPAGGIDGSFLGASVTFTRKAFLDKRWTYFMPKNDKRCDGEDRPRPTSGWRPGPM